MVRRYGISHNGTSNRMVGDIHEQDISSNRRGDVAVGNGSADIIGSKDKDSRSRCLLTRFQAGDGHAKAPESAEYRQRTMKSVPAMWLG